MLSSSAAVASEPVVNIFSTMVASNLTCPPVDLVCDQNVDQALAAATELQATVASWDGGDSCGEVFALSFGAAGERLGACVLLTECDEPAGVTQESARAFSDLLEAALLEHNEGYASEPMAQLFMGGGEQSTFTGNFASDQGGGTNSTITDNVALDFGGGIFSINGNWATDFGGGMNSRFTSNWTSESGGGIDSFVNNWATDSGGGILSSIVNNWATDNGGGIY